MAREVKLKVDGEVVDTGTVGDDEPLQTESAQQRDDDAGDRGFRTVEEIANDEPAGSIPVDNDNGGGGSSGGGSDETNPEKIDLNDPGQVLEKLGDNLGKNAQASLRRADKFGRSFQEVSKFSQEAAEDALIEQAQKTQKTLEDQEEKLKNIETEQVKIGGEVKEKEKVLENIQEQQRQAEQQTETIQTFTEALKQEENQQAKIQQAKENPNIKVTEVGNKAKLSVIQSGETVKEDTVNTTNRIDNLSLADQALMDNTRQPGSRENLGGAIETFTEADNFLADQALKSGRQIQERAEKARKSTQQIDPESLNPVSLTANIAAGIESAARETGETIITGDEFNLEQATNVSEDRVRELQADIGEFTAPVQKPVQTANLLTASAGRILTSPLAQDEQQISPDTDAGSTANFLSSTFQSAKDDPTRFTIGLGLGRGLERLTTTGIRGADAEQATSTLKNTGQKLDPATGIGRNPRPGETRTPLTQQITNQAKDIAPNQVNQVTGFLKGDLETTERARVERPRQPGEPNIRNTEQITEVVNGNREGFQRTINDRVIQQVEETQPKTRRQVLREIADEQLQEIKRFTQNPTSKGQTLVKPKTEQRTRPREPDTPRINRQDRRQDVAQTPKNQRIENPRDRFRNNINQPRPNTETRNDLGIGAALGATNLQTNETAQNQGQDIGKLFGNPQDTDNKTDPVTQQDTPEIFDNPETPRIDTPRQTDTPTPDPFRQPRQTRKPREPDTPRKKRTPRKPPDNPRTPRIGFGDQQNTLQTRSTNQDNGDREARFAPSLDALLTGKTEEKSDFNTEQTFSGLETRPIITNPDTDNENTEIRNLF